MRPAVRYSASPAAPAKPPTRTAPAGSAGRAVRPASDVTTSTPGRPASRAAMTLASPVPPSSSRRRGALTSLQQTLDARHVEVLAQRGAERVERALQQVRRVHVGGEERPHDRRILEEAVQADGEHV